MGWFKKEKEEEVPSLPELPKLPELSKEDIPRLPSFPNNSFGEKFSQNSIKEAVRGEKEETGGEVDEFEEERKIPEPPKPILTRELSERDEIFERKNRRVKEAEPLFVRIDRFEECSRIFEKIREKMMSIEKMLKDTKKIKEEEEKELSSWENKIKTIKEEIEKVDKEIFSKIE